MELPIGLVNEFAKVTYDENKTKAISTAYATAVITNDGSFVRFDGSDITTPAVFAVKAHNGDRVLISIQNRTVIVTNNITTPSITTGVLEANVGIIVHGYLTTNEDRVTYDDQNNQGITFSAGGIGAYGLDGSWKVTNSGKLTAQSVDLSGKITATSGAIGDFKIDSALYSNNKSSISHANTGVYIGADGIGLGANSPFKVTNLGKLTATDAEVSGMITASSGYLGSASNGFTIDQYGIYSGAHSGSSSSQNENGYFTLANTDFTRYIAGANRTNLRIALGENFGVTNSGVVYASNVDISGKITASSGAIGDFTINSAIYTNNKSSISHTNNGVYIGADGIALGASSPFKVTNLGALTATNADISGKIVAKTGNIGGFIITSDNNDTCQQNTSANGGHRYGTSLYVHSSDSSYEYEVGIKGAGGNTANLAFYVQRITKNATWASVTNMFTVDHKGHLKAVDADISGAITANSGTIGMFTIANEDDSSCQSKTSANGGHRYPKSLYTHHVYDGIEYESGLKGDGVTDGSAIFYVVKHNSGATWSSADAIFSVNNKGVLRAVGANISGAITATSLTLDGATIPYSKVTNTPDLTVYIAKDGTIGNTPAPGTTGFTVSSAGALTASNVIVYGEIYASAGTIGGFSISSSTNSGTTANGGHVYASSLYTHSSDDTYEYEAGITGGGAYNNAAFYIKRMAKNASWSSSEHVFYVRNDGYIYATVGNIAGWSISTTALSRGGGYASSDSNSMYFGSSGLSILNKFYVDNTGKLFIEGGEAHIRSTSNTSSYLKLENSSGTAGLNLYYDSSNQKSKISAIGTSYSNLDISAPQIAVAGSTLVAISAAATGNVTLSGGSISASGAFSAGSGSTTYIHVAPLNSTTGLNQNKIELKAADITLTGAITTSSTLSVGDNTTVSGTLQTSGNINIVSAAESAYAVGVQNGVKKVQLYMASNGQMGVYNNTDSHYVICEDPSNVIRMPQVYANTNANAANIYIDQYGRTYRSTASSKRYKKNIKPLEDFKKVLDIPVVSFVYREGYLYKEDRRYGLAIPGFIAEDVETYYEIAAERDGDRIEDWNVRCIVPPMLAVEQDHEKRLAALEAENATLKEKIAQLMGGAA